MRPWNFINTSPLNIIGKTRITGILSKQRNHMLYWDSYYISYDIGINSCWSTVYCGKWVNVYRYLKFVTPTNTVFLCHVLIKRSHKYTKVMDKVAVSYIEREIRGKLLVLWVLQHNWQYHYNDYSSSKFSFTNKCTFY